MQQKAKKDSINSLKDELDRNFLSLLQNNYQHKTPNDYWLYAVYHIMIIYLIAQSKKSEVADLIIGIIFLVAYISLNFFMQRYNPKNSALYNTAFMIIFIIICVLTYNAFSLVQLFIQSSQENSFKVMLQIAFHSYTTVIFSGLAIQFLRIGRLNLYYSLVLIANLIYFVVIIYQKYIKQIDFTLQNFALDVINILANIFLNYYLYFSQKYNLNFSKFLSFQKDLNEQKFKKLEFFITSLENQEIILVQHKQSDQNNEFISDNRNAKDHISQMHRIYNNIKNYETEEDQKIFIHVLQNKSSRKENLKNPKMYTFKLKQEYQESISANFVSFQDLQAKYKNNDIDLDKSMNYYAIQIVQNNRLFLKISKKFLILQYFIETIRGFAKGDEQRLKIINVYEDFCHIIQNELDLYRVLTFPKEKIVESSSNLDNELKNQQIKYSVQLIQKNISTFFELYKHIKRLDKHFLNIDQKINQKNHRLTREIYLMIIHIIMNTIITFIVYHQKIEIEFKEESQKLILQINILKSEEQNSNDQKVINNIKSNQESFENIINKVKKIKNAEVDLYSYNKEEIDDSKLTYNFYITLHSQKDQNHSIYENNFKNNLSAQEYSFHQNNSKYPSSSNQSDRKQQQQRQNGHYYRKNQKEYTFAEEQSNYTQRNLI